MSSTNEKYSKYLIYILLLITILVPNISFSQTDVKELRFQTDASTGSGSQEDITGLSLLGITIVGSNAANRIVSFEMSDNITAFSPVSCTKMDDLTISTFATATGTTPQRWQCPVGGFKKFQVRITGGSTGTITVVGLGLSRVSGKGSSGGGGGGSSLTIVGIPNASEIVEWASANSVRGSSTTGTGSVVKGTAPVITSPTGITKADVGLGNVDNTSNATERAATKTLTNTTLTSPIITNPTGLTSTDVGLGNVNNTSNATERAAARTLTNATIDFSNNTLLTTLSQLNAAITDANIPPETRTITINGTTNEITCTGSAQDLSANRTWTCGLSSILDLSSKTLRIPHSNTLPGSCAAGDVYIDDDAVGGLNYYVCIAGVWVVQGSSLNITAPTILGRITIGTGAVENLTAAQVKTILSLSNVDNTSDATKWTSTKKLTNTSIAPRKTTCTPVANVITFNADTNDICEYLSLAATTTIANPTTATAFDDQQIIVFELSGTNPQTISWGNKYTAEFGIPLPTGTTGAGTYNRFAYRYSAATTNFGLIASTKGDDTRTTVFASATTYAPVSDNAEVNEMVMTGAAGTVTISAPTGTPGNNKKLLIKIMCTVGAQTLSWNGTYIDSANVTKPTTCPLLSTKWVMVGVLYSTQTTNWQVIASTN